MYMSTRLVAVAVAMVYYASVPSALAFAPRGVAIDGGRPLVGAHPPAGRSRLSPSCAVASSNGAFFGYRRAVAIARAPSRAAPMKMMFDTLTESMTAITDMFSGQKTITESR